MKLPRLIIIILILAPLLGYSQKKRSEADWIALASEMKDEFPDEEIYCPHQRVTYEFSFDKEEGTCVATETSVSGVVSLRNSQVVPFPKFYDDNSKIEYSKVTPRSGWDPAEDEYYSSDGIFHSDARVRYHKLNFTEFGQFKEITFIKKYTDLRYLTTAYLHEPFPVGKSELTFVYPDWVDIEFVERNFGESSVKKEAGKASGGMKKVSYVLSNAAPMRRSNGIPGVSHVYPHIIILVKGYATQGKKESYFSNTDDLYKWYAGLVSKVDNRPAKLTHIVQDLTRGLTTKEEKMKAIYYWVQKNIRYIAFEDGIAGFQPEACDKVYEKRYGDCKGMANLTKEMLKIAGIDARLTWLGTSTLDYDYSIPSLAVDNHMICSVVEGENILYLDATEKFTEFGEYAQRIQGRPVLIEDGTGYLLRTIPEQDAKNNSIWLTQNLALQGETLSGNSTYVFSGESKASILNASAGTKSENWETAAKGFLSKGSKNCKVSNIQHSDLENLDEDVMLNYDVSIDNAVSAFGKELYVELDYYKDFYYFEIDEPREFDYVFSEKKYRESTITLELPPGYKVQDLPNPLEITDPDFSFKVNFTQNGNTLEYSKTLVIPHGRIPREKIGNWNNAIKQLKDTYDTPIILTKN